jgi:hypothetical protein
MATGCVQSYRRDCSSRYFLDLALCRSLEFLEGVLRKHPFPIKNSRIAAWTTAVSDGFASWVEM